MHTKDGVHLFLVCFNSIKLEKNYQEIEKNRRKGNILRTIVGHFTQVEKQLVLTDFHIEVIEYFSSIMKMPHASHLIFVQNIDEQISTKTSQCSE